MTESLKALLFTIRQHPSYPELLEAAPKPRRQKFKPLNGEIIDQFAKAIHAAGMQDMHDQWIAFLTGDSPQGE